MRFLEKKNTKRTESISDLRKVGKYLAFSSKKIMKLQRGSIESMAAMSPKPYLTDSLKLEEAESFFLYRLGPVSVFSNGQIARLELEHEIST